MNLDPGSVTAALRHLLERVEGAAVTVGTELPERRYVTTGGAVYDCPQVTVSGNSVQLGIAGSDEASQFYAGQCGPGWTITIELAIVRGAAERMTGRRGTEIPSVKDIESDTLQADKDASVLTRAITDIAGPGTDQLGLAPVQIAFGEVAGNLTAVQLTTTLNLWDIPVDLDAG